MRFTGVPLNGVDHVTEITSCSVFVRHVVILSNVLILTGTSVSDCYIELIIVIILSYNFNYFIIPTFILLYNNMVRSHLDYQSKQKCPHLNTT